ncbi:hypothetical protein GCM10025865_13960 [Paraoerskovia sediminicola]|uniref:ABC1 atypical kinase-like domain-containing protein n=1 Tax=Paraoerskovia sediminicola TaxID=1138587 RepID=A0ABM8G223_9CELL|nr:AarF/UbiB family protein [Paraoerskovia sediminicola]BDZ42097.1 hypothetical protein GCM10025865_13960 [Paraoerskovia sediminicola]
MTAVLAAVFHVVVVAWVVRRLLGVQVGWPRTILLSLIVGVSAGPLWEYVTDLLEIPTRTIGLSSNDAVGVLLVMVLVTAWIVAVDAGLLTVLEALVPTGSIRSPLAIVQSSPRWFRRQRRYVSIVVIALRHGLGGLFRRGGDLGGRSGVRHEDTAARARAALTDGGVTFVKLGQMLAARADLLPPAYVSEFSQLHSEVPAETWPVVQGTIEGELARPISEVFTHVEEVPLAGASVAQVHRATLRTGERVVLKVQRSSSRAEVEADLDIIVRLAELLQNRTRWGRRIGVLGLAVGFAGALREELDYRVEVGNMRAVADTSSGEVDVPAVRPELCTSHLLVMEELEGSRCRVQGVGSIRCCRRRRPRWPGRSSTAC